MKKPINRVGQLAALSLASALAGFTSSSQATVDGITGANHNFVACQFNIPTPDGDSVPMWGYGVDDGDAVCQEGQYPGPTLIVNEGDTVNITLRNNLPVDTSIVFPGQTSSTTTTGSKGLITQEVTADGATTVIYTFEATHPGTFMYESGSNPALQTEMGLLGAIIVRPTGFDSTPVTIVDPTLGSIEKANAAQTAYGGAGTHYDYEYLFLLSEMDPEIHKRYALGQFQNVDNTNYHEVLWFINGRNFPNTLSQAGDPTFPHQPYNSIPETRPGEKVLIRLIGGSRHAHPFHTHGANAQVIAQDGRLLESTPGSGPDVGRSDYTILTYSGQTYDAIFQWTGKDNGWDIYGPAAGDALAGVPPHTCGVADDTLNNKTGVSGSDGYHDTTWEWCADHDVAAPVFLPATQDMTFGGFFSGSQFIGTLQALPPGEGGLNPTGAYLYAWHSHNEKELVNNDVFPGGMFTALFVHPYPTFIQR